MHPRKYPSSDARVARRRRQRQERAARKRAPAARSCGQKVGYGTRAEAYGHLSRLRGPWSLRAQTLDVYHCRFCRQYHVGNKTPAPRTQGAPHER